MIPNLAPWQNSRRLHRSSYPPQKSHPSSRVLCFPYYPPTLQAMFPMTLPDHRQFQLHQSRQSILSQKRIGSKLASSRRSRKVHHLPRPLPIFLPLTQINPPSVLSMPATPGTDPLYISCKLWQTTALQMIAATTLPRKVRTAGKPIALIASESVWR